MTSQLALMNSMAVALASDSAVTIGSKTFDGVKKIFRLESNPKIGIMISNVANYIPCNVSWERVIRMFDLSIKKEFSTVEECVQKFKKFVSDEKVLAPNSENSISLQYDLIKFVEYWIRPEQKRQFQEVIKEMPGDIYTEFEGLDLHVNKTIESKIASLKDRISGLISELSADQEFEHKRMMKIHSDTVKQASEIFCEKHDIPESQLKKIFTIMSYHLCAQPNLEKRYNWRDFTNVVIAGFGSTQITPELHELKVGAIIDDKIGAFFNADVHGIRIPSNLKDTGDLENLGNGNYSASAFIIPYAQVEEIQNILNGVHPEFQQRYLLTQIPTNMVKTVTESIIPKLAEIPGVGPSTLEKIVESITGSSEELEVAIRNEIDEGRRHWAGATRRQRFRDSTRNMDAIQLSKFAKKIVTIEAEVAYYSNQRNRSVGGEIVVAYITMEDGLKFVE